MNELTQMAIASFANKVRGMAEDQNISVEIMYGTCLTIINNIYELINDEDRLEMAESLRTYIDSLTVPTVLK